MASQDQNRANLHVVIYGARVRVADVKSDLSSNGTNAQHVEGTVQLVWPFSSATSQLSLLVIEKDVSFRETAAQLRVTFHGACAKEVARFRIGIGDVLRLALKGATARVEREELSTPGKKVGFDLHFYTAVHLQASTYDGQVKTVDFVAPVPPVVLNGNHAFPVTPLRNGTIDIPKRFSSNTTPALKKTPRLSSNSYPDSLVDLFTEDDGHIQGRGRKRTKFARLSNQWRLEDGLREESRSEQGQPQNESPQGHPDTEQSVEVPPVVNSPDVASSPVLVSSEERQTPAISEKVEAQSHNDYAHDDTKLAFIDELEPTDDSQKVKMAALDEQASVIDVSLSTVAVPQVPVEGISPDQDIGLLSVSAPNLADMSSIGLPLVPPLTFQRHTFSAFSQELSDLDASTFPVDQSSIHPFSLDTPRFDEPADATGIFLQPQPLIPHAVTTIVDEIQSNEILPTVIHDVIDLDKLQEQIDMSHAEFIPEAFDQIIEDEDMYGPPRDRESGMSSQYIDEVRSRMSSADPDTFPDRPDFTAPGDQSPPYSNLRDIIDGIYTQLDDPLLDLMPVHNSLELPASGQITFQPYPFHLELQSEVEGHASVDVEVDNDAGQLEFEDTTHTLREEQPQFLDGTSTLQIDGELLQSTELTGPEEFEFESLQMERPSTPGAIERPVPLTAEVVAPVRDVIEESSLVHEYDSERNIPDVHHQHEADEVMVDPQPSEHVSFQGHTVQDSNLPSNILTPEATQVAERHIENGTKNESMARVDLPPTPIQSQLEVSQQHSFEGLHSQHDTISSAVPEATPLRPVSHQVSPRKGQHEGIESPYFTPRTSTIAPNSNMHSLKVPGSSRMRLRSSSPVNFLADHLETERLAALETQARQDPNPPDQEEPQSDIFGVTTTPLEYFAHLDTLAEYYNQQVDVMAVCTTDSVIPERAKSGPKDYFTTIHFADPSIADSDYTITAQIFRPRKAAMPVARRGDVLLLRRFKVQTKLHKPTLLSTDESAWAVYRSGATLDTSETERSKVISPPIVLGPPVEYGPFEDDNASRLLQWWLTSGSKYEYAGAFESTPADITKASANKGVKKPAPTPINLRRSPRKHRKSASIDTDQSPTSPTFQPESPSLSQSIAQSPRSIANSISPTSMRSTRSQQSPSKAQTKSNKTQLKTPIIDRLSTKSPRQPRSDDPAPVISGISFKSKNLSSSNSVASSVTETSGGSKRRRYERRSISLVHKLRDGTEWVDIEQEEIFSVTESESGDDHDDDSDGEDSDTEDNQHDLAGDQDIETTIPSTTPYHNAATEANIETGHNPEPSGPHATVDINADSTHPTTPTRKSRSRPRKDVTVDRNTTETPARRTRRQLNPPEEGTEREGVADREEDGTTATEE